MAVFGSCLLMRFEEVVSIILHTDPFRVQISMARTILGEHPIYYQQALVQVTTKFTHLFRQDNAGGTPIPRKQKSDRWGCGRRLHRGRARRRSHP